MSLNAVFTVSPRSDQPIQIGERPRDVLVLQDGPLAPRQTNLDAGSQPRDGDPDKPAVAGGDAAEPADGDANASSGGPSEHDGTTLRVSDEITISLQDYLDKGLVRITQGKGRVEIEMASKMLFESGDARLSPPALRVLRTLAKSLERISSHLQVEGHTDNVPISTQTFPSNWELSAARAASVVHFLSRSGIEPWRMAAVGLGQHRPIAENNDAEGRAANRRVTIVILTGHRDQRMPVDEEVPWAEGPALEAQ